MNDIVLIAVDTLRPDHLGCYGYPKPTSPSIDRLAAQSLVFDRAFAAGIPTTPSFTTMLTGLHPYRHRVVTHPGDHLPGSTQLLAQLAKAAGYTTIACDNMVVQSKGRGSWFARGYDHYTGYVYAPFGEQSGDITDRALRLLDKVDGPSFLFLHYWDPHTPYGPKPPYDTMHYEPGSSEVSLADVRAIHPSYYDAFIGAMDLEHPDDYAYVIAQYDGEITQVDAQIGRLLDGLDDDTIVLLLSDHGECFGEGDFYFDHHGLYDAVTRLTMLLRAPEVHAGRSDAMVSHEDVVPTLCELAGLPLPDYPLTGRSMISSPGRERIISVESTRQSSLALRTLTHKVIQPITSMLDGTPLPDFYGRERAPEPMLFDLRADPQERDDIAADEPELTGSMLADLEEWRVAEVGDDVDPVRAAGITLPLEVFLSRRKSRRPSNPR